MHLQALVLFFNKMMKVIKHICLVCSLLIATACEVDVPDNLTPGLEQYYLSLSSQSLYFSAQPESKTLDIKTNFDWSFSDYDHWFSISHKNGHGDCGVIISTTENESADLTRASVLYLNASKDELEHTKQISIEQAAPQPYIYVNLDEGWLDISGGAATYRINIEANTLWTAYINGGDWCTVTPAEDLSYIDIFVEENITGSERSANISLIGATSINFDVKQQTAKITTNNTALSFSRNGGSYLINLSSDASWSASTDAQWLDISKTNGEAGEHEIVISATENWSTSDRVGYIYFYVGPDILSVFISQEKAYISTIDQISIRALGDENTYADVKSNFPWEVISCPDWMEASVGEGIFDGHVRMKVQNNRDSVSRSGMVTLGKEGLSLKADILVTQEGKYFAVNNEALALESKGGTMQVTINTNDAWNITLKDPAQWLEISDISGEETRTVNFTAGDNPSVNTRSTTANIAPGDLEAVDIVIRQEARYLSIDTYGVNFFSKGGTSSPIVISTDGTFSIECLDDWISISYETGNQNNVFYITAQQNNTGYRRVGKVNIYLTDLVDGEMCLTVNVEQLKPGGNFNKEDFDEDADWGSNLGKSFILSAVGFAEDENWDSPDYHGLSLSITGFTPDDGWDGNFGSMNVEKEDYSDDSQRDDAAGNGNIENDDYGDDDSYDSSNGSGGLGKEDFTDEEDYDNF